MGGGREDNIQNLISERGYRKVQATPRDDFSNPNKQVGSLPPKTCIPNTTEMLLVKDVSNENTTFKRQLAGAAVRKGEAGGEIISKI